MQKIFIDAGHNHSGVGTGAAANGLREQDITFHVSHILGEILKPHFEIRLSRPTLETNVGTDRNSAINARWQAANSWGADYFISIHVNAGGGTGAETFYFNGGDDRGRRSEAFSKCVNDTYAEATGLRNRGSKPDSRTALGAIGVLRRANMPAILPELAFIDSPANNPDVPLLRGGHRRMAEALAKGIFKYFGINARGSASSPQAASPNNAGAANAINREIRLLTNAQIGALGIRAGKAEVIDLPTRRRYKIFWGGPPGGRHTDFSPLTPEDTTIMKEVAGGKWNWNPRPAILLIGDMALAAAVHSFPHGSIIGGNPGLPNMSNARPSSGWPVGGHMCMYFADSAGGTRGMTEAAKNALELGRKLFAANWPVEERHINRMVELGVIRNPEYWKAQNSVRWLNELMANFGKPGVLNPNLNHNTRNIDEALNMLHRAGVMNSPDYWRKQVTGGSIEFLGRLIIDIANRVAV